MAEADKPAKKRKPTFFEQIFGGLRTASERKNDRRVFGRRDRGDVGSIRVIDQRGRKNRKSRSVADSDPEGDPGLRHGQSALCRTPAGGAERRQAGRAPPVRARGGRHP